LRRPGLGVVPFHGGRPARARGVSRSDGWCAERTKRIRMTALESTPDALDG
jgi:hypothetical protein